MKAMLISTGRHDLSYLEPLRKTMGAEHNLLKLDMYKSENVLSTASEIKNTSWQSVQQMVCNKPNCIIVIGDRPETLSICIYATVLRIPIAHLHGGEVTLGAIDNVIRNAISQLAKWNFVAYEQAASALRHMNVPGEIYVTGSPAIDLMMSKKRERVVGKDIVFAYHPETMSNVLPIDQIKRAAKIALSMSEPHGKIICVGANPDAGGLLIDDYLASLGAPFVMRKSMGSEEYWDTLASCKCLVGNTSSGVIEAPVLGVPFIEIGDRQKGRYRGSYGDGKACARIAGVLTSASP